MLKACMGKIAPNTSEALRHAGPWPAPLQQDIRLNFGGGREAHVYEEAPLPRPREAKLSIRVHAVSVALTELEWAPTLTNSTVVRSGATRRSARHPEIRDCISQKICGRFVAESAKRHFSATNGANVPNETLVSLRTILPVFVSLAPYGNPGSTLEDRRSAGSVEVVSGTVLRKQLTPRSVGHSRDQ